MLTNKNNVFKYTTQKALKQWIDNLFCDSDGLASINNIVIEYAKGVKKIYQQNEKARFSRRYSTKEWLIRILTLGVWGKGNTKLLQKSFNKGVSQKLGQYNSKNDAFKELTRAGIPLTLENRTRVSKAELPLDMAEGLVELKKEGILTQDNINTISAARWHRDMARALVTLYRRGILHETTRELISYGSNPGIMANALVRLCNTHLKITSIHLDMIKNHVEHSAVMVNTLVELHESGALTPEYQAAINTDSVLAALEKLKRKHILASENILSVVNAKKPDAMADALLIMADNENVLTDENRWLVAQARDPQLMARAFVQLDNAKILTFENKMIVSRSDNPNQIARLLVDLEQDGLLTPCNRMLLTFTKAGCEKNTVFHIINGGYKGFSINLFLHDAIKNEELNGLSSEKTKMVEQALMRLLQLRATDPFIQSRLDDKRLAKWISSFIRLVKKHSIYNKHIQEFCISQEKWKRYLNASGKKLTSQHSV